jgi:hypothetical protein
VVLFLSHRIKCSSFLDSHRAYLVVSWLMHTKCSLKCVREIEKPVDLILVVLTSLVTFT